MLDHIFRRYDIRGRVGEDLDIGRVSYFAKAVALFFKEKNSSIKKIIVGMDGRNHSPAIKEMLCSGLIESGMDVAFAGICTTPSIYFALNALEYDAGIMITASHNPKEYNGFKICIGRDAVWGEDIQRLKDIYKLGLVIENVVSGEYKEDSIVDVYIDWISNHFKHIAGSDIRVILDCGNGAAGIVWPKLIKNMNWSNVELLFSDIDGNYPNHEADPTVDKNMLILKERVKKSKAAAGLGFDGDADRMAAVTESGELLLGDKLLALFSEGIIKDNPGASIVFDIKCSSALPQLLEKWNAKPIISPSGNPIIKETLKKNKAVVSGELSCHFTFTDRFLGFDDGIYSAMRLLEIMIKSGKGLDELISIFPKKINSPELRIQCAEHKKFDIVDNVGRLFANRKDMKILTIDGIRVQMEHGWAVLRASNTQDVICFRCEADSVSALNSIKQEFFKAMNVYLDEKSLKELKGI